MQQLIFLKNLNTLSKITCSYSVITEKSTMPGKLATWKLSKLFLVPMDHVMAFIVC